MRPWIKWAVVISALALFIAMVLAAGLFAVLSGTVPSRSGTAQVPNMQSPATLVREEGGFRVISAGSDADAMRALGFAHAQDRLWQMDVLRRTGLGTLSELLGAGALPSDELAHSLDFEGAADWSFGVLPKQERAMLEAYASGVNAFLAQERRSLASNLPPEYLVAGRLPEEWKPRDSLVIFRLVLLYVSPSPLRKTEILQLAAQGLTPREIEDILPQAPVPPAGLANLRDFLALNKPYADKLAPKQVPGLLGAWMDGRGSLQVSARSSGALSIGAADRFVRPALPYPARIQTDTRTIAGLSLPGTPLWLTASNGSLFWSLLTPSAETFDIVLEQVRGNPPSETLTISGWRDVVLTERVIEPAGAPKTALTRRVADGRPLLPPRFGDLDRIFTVANAASLRWHGTAGLDRTFHAFLDMQRSSGTVSASEALRNVIGPTMAIALADRAGRRNVLEAGRVVERDPVDRIKGTAPMPGWLAAYQPTRGDFRVARDRVEANGASSADGKSVALNDLLSVRDVLLQTVKRREDDGPLRSELRRWTGTRQSQEWQGVFIALWHRNTVQLMLADDLGATVDLALRGTKSPIVSILRHGGARDWCDNSGTPDAPEGCEQIVTEALDKTLREMEVRFGKRRSGWRWRDVVQVLTRHETHGRNAWFGEVINQRSTSLGLAEHGLDLRRFGAGFSLTQGNIFIALWDETKPLFEIQSSIAVSGNPVSRHYAIGESFRRNPLEPAQKLSGERWILQPAETR